MIKVSKNAKIVASIFTLLLLVSMLYSFMSYWSHRERFKINILVLPEDSQLQIDGKATKPGTHYLSVGSHTVTATRQFFDKTSRKINTSDLSYGEDLYIMPLPNSEAARKWLLDNPEVQSHRETVSGKEFNKKQEKLSSSYPFLAHLPRQTAGYKIDYSFEADGKIEFTINLFGKISGPEDYARYIAQLKQSKSEALGYLKEVGVKTDQYKITFIPDLDNK